MAIKRQFASSLLQVRKVLSRELVLFVENVSAARTLKKTGAVSFVYFYEMILQNAKYLLQIILKNVTLATV